MKRFLTYGLVLCVSALMLLAGSGFNVVHYCCDCCRSAGIMHVAEESCEAIHHHEHHHHDGHCHHENNGCWMLRLSVDHATPSTPLALPTLACHWLGQLTLSVSQCLPTLEARILTHVSTGPPLVGGRLILSLIRILIL